MKLQFYKLVENNKKYFFYGEVYEAMLIDATEFLEPQWFHQTSSHNLLNVRICLATNKTALHLVPAQHDTLQSHSIVLRRRN